MTTSIINLPQTYNALKMAFGGKKATTVTQSNHEVKVTHYAATILTITADGEITLDNGGYETATTKRHLNLALETIGKRVGIYQKKGSWYFSDNQPFERHFKMTTY